MRSVGFFGGHSLYELGPVSDVILFFKCLNCFVVAKKADRDWSLLTSRLYRGYLRVEELELASQLMSEVRNIFLMTPSSAVYELRDDIDEQEGGWIVAKGGDLEEVFSKYFDLFIRAKESALSFLKEFEIYQPVRVIASDMPAFILERRRSLAEYDNLSSADLPFWLR